MAELSSGTSTIFNMSTALVGWTKNTSFNDCMLRVVSGTTSSGGSVNFSSVFQTQTPTGSVGSAGTVGTDSTILSESQIPSHTHSIQTYTAYLPPTPNPGAASVLRFGINPSPTQGVNPLTGSPINPGAPQGQPGLVSSGTTSTGNSEGHAHPTTITSPGTITGDALSLNVKYVDMIIATRD